MKKKTITGAPARRGGAAVDSVTVNNFRAAYDATRHLLHEGCSRIAFVGGPLSATTASRRLAGYRSALREAGLPDLAELVARGDFKVEGGQHAMRTLLNSTTFDGLLVANGPMAMGALGVLAQRGVVIPDDVAVVSFDEQPWVRAYRPTLSVVQQGTYEIGQRATELLLERIADPTVPPRRLSLPATLQVGESSLRRHRIIEANGEAG